MPSHHTSPKRERRRMAREAELGPERTVVSTEGDVHELDCGHGVWVKADERCNVRRRRCARCLRGPRVPLALELNEKHLHPSPESLPYFCSECGAGNAWVLVEGTLERWIECRECHALERRVESKGER